MRLLIFTCLITFSFVLTSGLNFAQGIKIIDVDIKTPFKIDSLVLQNPVANSVSYDPCTKEALLESINASLEIIGPAETMSVNSGPVPMTESLRMAAERIERTEQVFKVLREIRDNCKKK